MKYFLLIFYLSCIYNNVCEILDKRFTISYKGLERPQYLQNNIRRFGKIVLYASLNYNWIKDEKYFTKLSKKIEQLRIYNRYFEYSLINIPPNHINMGSESSLIHKKKYFDNEYYSCKDNNVKDLSNDISQKKMNLENSNKKYLYFKNSKTRISEYLNFDVKKIMEDLIIFNTQTINFILVLQTSCSIFQDLKCFENIFINWKGNFLRLINHNNLKHLPVDKIQKDIHQLNQGIKELTNFFYKILQKIYFLKPNKEILFFKLTNQINQTIGNLCLEFEKLSIKFKRHRIYNFELYNLHFYPLEIKIKRQINGLIVYVKKINENSESTLAKFAIQKYINFNFEGFLMELEYKQSSIIILLKFLSNSYQKLYKLLLVRNLNFNKLFLATIKVKSNFSLKQTKKNRFELKKLKYLYLTEKNMIDETLCDFLKSFSNYLGFCVDIKYSYNFEIIYVENFLNEIIATKNRMIEEFERKFV